MRTAAPSIKRRSCASREGLTQCQPAGRTAAIDSLRVSLNLKEIFNPKGASS